MKKEVMQNMMRRAIMISMLKVLLPILFLCKLIGGEFCQSKSLRHFNSSYLSILEIPLLES